MITIFKYQIPIKGNQVVEMPQGAQVLSAQVQRGELCLWARVDATAEKVPRRITIRGTGHQCTLEDGRFIDTFQIQEGTFVFHVFDGGEM